MCKSELFKHQISNFFKPKSKKRLQGLLKVQLSRNHIEKETHFPSDKQLKLMTNLETSSLSGIHLVKWLRQEQKEKPSCPEGRTQASLAVHPTNI